MRSARVEPLAPSERLRKPLHEVTFKEKKARSYGAASSHEPGAGCWPFFRARRGRPGSSDQHNASTKSTQRCERKLEEALRILRGLSIGPAAADGLDAAIALVSAAATDLAVPADAIDWNSELEQMDDEVQEYLAVTTGRRGTRKLLHSPSQVVLGDAPAAADGVDGASLWVMPAAVAHGVSGAIVAELAAKSMPEALLARARASLDDWNNDVLGLHADSGGHAMLLIGEALFECHGLYEGCNLDRDVVRAFLLGVEAGYGGNPYHNAAHGTDVALSLHLFLTRCRLAGRLSKTQTLAAIVGALVHDFNHPGTTNAHEAKVSTSRALAHSDRSILERHHLHSTFALLARHPSLDLFADLHPEARGEVRA